MFRDVRRCLALLPANRRKQWLALVPVAIEVLRHRNERPSVEELEAHDKAAFEDNPEIPTES